MLFLVETWKADLYLKHGFMVLVPISWARSPRTLETGKSLKNRALSRSSQPWVQSVPQSISHQVNGEHGKGKEHPREEDNPDRDLKEGTPLAHNVTPARDNGRDAGGGNQLPLNQ